MLALARVPQFAIALGAVEQCSYNTADCSDAGTCTTITDYMLNLNCASGYNYKCSGNKIDMEYYA